MNDTDGTAEWTEGRGGKLRYISAKIKGGDLVSLKASDQAALPHDPFDLLSFLRFRGLEEEEIEYRETAMKLNAQEAREYRAARRERDIADEVIWRESA